MAKSNQDGKKVNKSEAIREMLAQHPHAPSKEIVSLLGEKGIRVQPSLVYFIKSKQRHQQRQQKRARANETSQRMGSRNPVELILQVKRLAGEAGGMKNLKQLVDVLAE